MCQLYESLAEHCLYLHVQHDETPVKKRIWSTSPGRRARMTNLTTNPSSSFLCPSLSPPRDPERRSERTADTAASLAPEQVRGFVFPPADPCFIMSQWEWCCLRAAHLKFYILSFFFLSSDSFTITDSETWHSPFPSHHPAHQQLNKDSS